MAPEEYSAKMKETGVNSVRTRLHKTFRGTIGATLIVSLVATMVFWQSTSVVFAWEQKYASSSSNTPFQNVGEKTTTSTLRYIGMNYLTLYHMYDTSTRTLEQDFARFKNDGMNTIVITMFWYRLESSKGVYDQQFINNVIRVSNLASKYGLQVMIDFHTLVGHGDSWSNPQYVGVAMNLITDSEITAAYVAMVKWTVTQLKVLKNVWTYSVLNEPWYWPLDQWRKTNWINLIVDLSRTVKEVSGKPVTARFVGALFERDWSWDSRLLGALDFISVNAYLSEGKVNDVYWNDLDEYKAGFVSISQKAATFGKQVQVTEFGYSTSDDALQSNKYRAYTDIFKSTANVIGWVSWGWDCGYDRNNPTFTQIGEYSIVVQVTGSPRPAYSILTQNR